MVPDKLEYLCLLAIYGLIIGVLFPDQVRFSLRRRAFWLSFAIFGVSWTVIEIVGLRAEMWSYSTDRLCGIGFLDVPLEEYMIFFLIHLMTVASWECFAKPRVS